MAIDAATFPALSNLAELFKVTKHYSLTQPNNLVLQQLDLGYLCISKKKGVIMCSNCLVIINDPLTFEVTDIHKYFQNFTKFIGFNIAIDLLF